jgi:hypothetical protein
MSSSGGVNTTSPSPLVPMETRSLLSSLGDVKNEDLQDIEISKSESPLMLRIKCNSAGIDAPKPIDGIARDWFEICTSNSVDVKTLKEQGLCKTNNVPYEYLVFFC